MTEIDLRVAYLKMIFKDKYDVSIMDCHTIHFYSEDKELDFQYDLLNKEFYSKVEKYIFMYGYTKLSKTFKQIKKKNANYFIAYNEIEPHIKMPINEIKVFLISRVDEVEL